MIKYLSCGINDRQLAAGTIARIQSDDIVAAERCLQQQLLEVEAEDANGLLFGIFGQL